MKHISNIINLNARPESENEEEHLNIINPLSAKLVEAVFAMFYIYCRGTDELFSDKSRERAEKTQWQVCFSRKGFVSRKQIEKALRQLERHKYAKPPQLGEFLNWNEPTLEDYNFLPKEHAYNRAYQLMRDGDIDGMSPEQLMILEHAIHESDKYFLKNNPTTKTQPLFYRNYEIAVRDFISGKLKHIPKAIEDKTDETGEVKKQDEIKKGFENLKGYQSNINYMKQILGMKLDEDVVINQR
jgi:hypothetical protein